MRTHGSVTRKYSGAQMGEISMNLTAIGFSVLRETRGMTALMPMRRAIAREIRALRNLNHSLCK